MVYTMAAGQFSKTELDVLSKLVGVKNAFFLQTILSGKHRKMLKVGWKLWLKKWTKS